MKKKICLLVIMVLTVASLAGCGAKKETLLTLVNGSTKIELTEKDFESMGFEQEVTEANLRKKCLFGGVKLSDLMDKAKANDCSTIKVIAKDKMTVEIKAEDAKKYPIMLAKTQNGEKIPSGEGGPIKLIYPYNQYPEVKELYKPSQWSWFVVKVEFVK